MNKVSKKNFHPLGYILKLNSNTKFKFSSSFVFEIFDFEVESEKKIKIDEKINMIRVGIDVIFYTTWNVNLENDIK